MLHWGILHCAKSAPPDSAELNTAERPRDLIYQTRRDILHWSNKLCTGELPLPVSKEISIFKQRGDVAQKNACCKHMFLDVCCKALYRSCKSRWGCCKNRSGYCTCCNAYTRMFQVYVPNVFPSLSHVCCKYFHLDVAKVDLEVAYICVASIYFKWL
jgi:hypothetical protein